MDFKQQIRQKLIANIIIEKCKQCDCLVFRDAWCTQERVIRFTTPFFRRLFAVEENESGKWKTGDFVMFEVNNAPDSFVVNCVLNTASVKSAQAQTAANLIKTASINHFDGTDDIILKSWDLTRSDGDDNRLLEDFDRLINTVIPGFESELSRKINEPDATFVEGEQSQTTSNKYERNPKARAACLAAHGTACTVCGIDFGKAYGPEFAGKIEVHHIVPLSEIGQEYVVDPVRDLVPVCPNCHMALHSKPCGVYTVEELKRIKARNG